MNLDPYLAGLLFGDGTCHIGKTNRAYGIWIDQHVRNNYIAEHAKSKLEKLGFNVHKYNFRDKVRVLVYNKTLYLQFKELRSDATHFFKKLSVRKKLAFIGGFFDAEGTVTDRLVVYNQDVGLLKAIQQFYTKQKLTSYIYKFGKVHGVQVYKRNDIAFLQRNIPSLKMKSIPLVTKRR